MQKEEHYMESILYVGMDVHTTNYTLCTYTIENDQEFGLVQFKADYMNIVRYVNKLKEHHGRDTRIVCGYEAGGLGYSLYRSLSASGIECIIMAPSTMPKAPNERKTDYRRNDIHILFDVNILFFVCMKFFTKEGKGLPWQSSG